MKEVAFRCRKILRMIFRCISVSAASLILQACYGILPPDEPAEYGMPSPEYNQETSIRGKVVSKTTGAPIFGIKVSIDETVYWDRTDKNGSFYFYVPIQDVYRLKFEDVDGPYNDGLFQEQTLTIKKADTSYTLLISMDLDTETDAE